MYSIIARVASLALLCNQIAAFGVNPTVHSRFGVTSSVRTLVTLTLSVFYHSEQLPDLVYMCIFSRFHVSSINSGPRLLPHYLLQLATRWESTSIWKNWKTRNHV
jgi:hypothetical protein